MSSSLPEQKVMSTFLPFPHHCPLLLMWRFTMMSLRPFLLDRVLRRTGHATGRWLSSTNTNTGSDVIVNREEDFTVDDTLFLSQMDDALTMHHGKRPRFRGKPKFKSPRKRASSLLDKLNKEAVEISKRGNPAVLETPFRVGDAIEIQYIDQGGVNSKQVDKMRGVVLGRVNRGLNSAVYIRDVVFGEPIDRKIHLHSPLLKSLKVLEENFVFKKKKRVKRAKLYYLRDRLPAGMYRFSCVYVVVGYGDACFVLLTQNYPSSFSSLQKQK